MVEFWGGSEGRSNVVAEVIWLDNVGWIISLKKRYQCLRCHVQNVGLH